jgi:hypothetical protein
MELTQDQINQMQQMKQHFPYRIIYGMIDKNTSEFFTSVVTNMRIPNKLSKEGHTVFTIK